MTAFFYHIHINLKENMQGFNNEFITQHHMFKLASHLFHVIILAMLKEPLMLLTLTLSDLCTDFPVIS